MNELLNKYNYILTEFAVLERLRRSNNVCLDPLLEHALLIYDEAGRTEMGSIYDEYFDLQRNAKVPFLIFSPTWRANRERIQKAQIDKDVNRDAVDFMRKVKEKNIDKAEKILIGGLIGCKNDCYRPDEGLTIEASMDFHEWQIKKLVDAMVDFIFAASLPSIPEAEGIGKIMSNLTTPYILSFVIDKTGRLLDGTSLDEAFNVIDTCCKKKPVGFMVNCSHPSFLNTEELAENSLARLIGYQGNASDKSHSELNGSENIHVSNITNWGDYMIQLNKKYNITILGGCCGTNGDHLRYLVENIDCDLSKC